MLRKRKNKILVMIFVAAFVLSACNKVDLYQDLSEEDANQMLVLLAENGIRADKNKETRQNEVFWSLSVDRKDIVRARELLVKNNLPRKSELGLTGVYKEKGLIPTPDEQKARFLLALKGEIINSLERLPEVVDADVVLNIPTPDEFADAETKKRLKPTASVVVKLKPSDLNNVSEAKVQQFVANAVEGMNPRDVTVLLSYVEPGKMKARGTGDKFSPPVVSLGVESKPSEIAAQEEVMGLKVDVESKKKLKTYILIFIGVLLILAVALIIAVVQASRLRRRVEQGEGRAGAHPEIDGKVISEEPPQLGSGMDIGGEDEGDEEE